MRAHSFAAVCLAAFVVPSVSAQQACDGGPLSGVVHDTSHALVVGARLALDSGEVVTSDEQGRFSFRCVSVGKHRLHVSAESFGPVDEPVIVRAHDALLLTLVLHPGEVETSINVAGDSGGVDAADGGGIARTLTSKQIVELADDPDDFARELQALAATSGGGSATITVDGFQMDSKLPPKSSIAFIKVNPDLYSAEYDNPPYMGGRIEVYTRPGQARFHGDAYFTDGSSFLNAKDPFAASRAAIGKKRFGFDLNGPIRRQGSDFSLGLEHREIDDFAVVNATTLDAAGDAVSTVENVPTPQHLWIASARVGWQLGPKNIFTTTYSANVNSLSNVGVGGTTLPEAGYDSTQAEQTLRASDVTTVSAKVMHEVRASLRWRTRADAPLSTGTQVQVAGAFTGGGVTTGAQHTRETAIEFDDDVIVTAGRHLLKAGVQINDYIENQQIPNGFNGTYIFGGGMAPALDGNGNPVAGTSIAINGLEQYRRALLALAGGTPTAYTATTGTPIVDFFQVRNVVFVQDAWKSRPNLELSGGLRYAAQTAPTTLMNFAPRAGVAWSPDKKQRWTLRAHVGLFDSRLSNDMHTTQLEMDGVERVTSLIYTPVYGSPFAGATPLHTVRTYAPGLRQQPAVEGGWTVEHAFPHKWNAQASYYLIHAWDLTRTLNVNSPLNGQPTGPRPGVANENVLQYQQTGVMGGKAFVTSLSQFSYKVFQFSAGYVFVDLKTTSDGATSSPQSSLTDAGETARQSGQPLHEAFSNGQVVLPGRLSLSEALDVQSGMPYNIVTGMDNNGDGIFNDRPQYVLAGTANAIQTQYGLLVASGGVGVFPRNAGSMPVTLHLDMNLSRSFTLNSKARPDERQTLVLNVRSANVLNHTNITSVGNVLGSSLFGHGYAADAGRRIEIGARYSF